MIISNRWQESSKFMWPRFPLSTSPRGRVLVPSLPRSILPVGILLSSMGTGALGLIPLVLLLSAVMTLISTLLPAA